MGRVSVPLDTEFRNLFMGKKEKQTGDSSCRSGKPAGWNKRLQ